VSGRDGVTIHTEHPFLEPERDPVRRLRGRLTGTVTLWTAQHGPRPAGLTVSSLMVAAGEPAYLLALLDPDSDLAEALLGSGSAVVHLLQWRHRELADVFAGVSPAPGGAFARTQLVPTSWGPRVADAGSWSGVVLREERTVGWSVLVTCEVQHVELGEDDEPLVHRRGRYLEPPRT
jgi:flavin reductase (DIM6/NTAB) family NADH-FMN oxidoreductase RutF